MAEAQRMPTVVDILDNLGALQLKQKKYRQAEKSFEASLEIRQKTRVFENFNVAHALNGLGSAVCKAKTIFESRGGIGTVFEDRRSRSSSLWS
jgi:uncharacterized protein HemY